MMRYKRIGGALAATLLFQACATPLLAAVPSAAQTAPAIPPPSLKYYGKSETGRCTEGPGGPLSVTPAIALFILTTAWNVVRGELQRRARNEADRFTATYGTRTNVTTAAGPITCVEFTRYDAQGPAMTLWFEISPHGVQDGNMAPTPTAYVIRPAGIDYQRPMARTRGANPKLNLAVSLAMTFVIEGENGPEVRTYNPTGFAYENVALGSRNLSFVGQPSAVMPAPPQQVGATIAIAVTEKGPGGDFYTDIAGALESSKDAVQTLIEHYYGGD